jgi:hypothetical protein
MPKFAQRSPWGAFTAFAYADLTSGCFGAVRVVSGDLNFIRVDQ